MVNFKTDNLVIICYPAYAGGKFLINCLGLSNDAVLQDQGFAEQQLAGKFSQDDKFAYIKSSIDTTKFEWNDLNLGCNELFGINNDDYLVSTDAILLSDGMFNPVVGKLTQSNKKFFIVAHTPTHLEKYLNVWPNARIVYFVNSFDFILFRQPFINKNAWDVARGSSWPIKPPTTMEEFLMLDHLIREEISSRFDLHMWTTTFNRYKKLQCQEFDTVQKKINSLVWDTKNYFDADLTVAEIEKLYAILNLSGFNEDLIKQYYSIWIDKLVELKGY
jgi:hypothetical protein